MKADKKVKVLYSCQANIFVKKPYSKNQPFERLRQIWKMSRSGS